MDITCISARVVVIETETKEKEEDVLEREQSLQTYSAQKQKRMGRIRGLNKRNRDSVAYKARRKLEKYVLGTDRQ